LLTAFSWLRAISSARAHSSRWITRWMTWKELWRIHNNLINQ
jgi:hypothetical protein